MDFSPAVRPPLDQVFKPAVLWNRAFFRFVVESGSPVPVRFALEQPDGLVLHKEAEILPAEHQSAFLNFRFVERLLKFLLWSAGGSRVYFDGPQELGQALRKHFEDIPSGCFDASFMERVYEKPFELIYTSDLPCERSSSKVLGRHLDGNRIGFDLGGSDRKVAAVENGEVIFSEETAWNPYHKEDPDYHREGIADSLRQGC